MKKLKSAEEYLERFDFYTDEVTDVGSFEWIENASKEELIGIIKKIQLETIQTTVENCAEEAKFSITENALIEDGELYDYYDDGVYTYSISNSSILNVANKMKIELDETN